MSALKVAKWGNSLAVRLPADMVRELGLQEGDFVERDVLALKRALPKLSREQAIERMTAMAVPLSPGYKFDREEANARGPA